MPYHDVDAADPHELIGVALPGDETVTREMAAAFAEEFARMGFDRARVLAVFRQPFYAGAHRAWRLLGDDAIRRIVDESVAVWGRVTRVVIDRHEADDEPQGRPLPLVRRRS
jgi:hypothetical protein